MASIMLVDPVVCFAQFLLDHVAGCFGLHGTVAAPASQSASAIILTRCIASPTKIRALVSCLA